MIAILAACSVRKAPGADGLGVGELRSWPRGLIELLADFYELVEELGVWPGGLDLNLVAMLPKGGSDEPGDRRPIVLLPVVYRLWAAARAGPLRDWLKVAGLLGEGAAEVC